jgi:replicative DNA helicase
MSMLAPVPMGDARVIPHNIEAEQSALGGMLLSQEAIADVLEVVTGSDFYAPKHELIFNAIIYLFGRGEPTDVIAVTDYLNKQGNLLKAGGADYLHSLSSFVPTAANAGYYAKIVADKAILRRLIDAGTRIAQSGYESQGEVEDLVNQAQSEVFAVVSQTAKDDYVGLSESIDFAIRDIEAAQNRGGDLTGIPTGFTNLDTYTHGLHSGQLVIVAARPPLLLTLHVTQQSNTTKPQSSSHSKWVAQKLPCACFLQRAEFICRACVREHSPKVIGRSLLR